MLISFGARNYMSFREGFEVSMELSSSCPETTSAGKKFSEAICIIGANASGKTNVIRSLTFIADFCCNSFNSKPEDSLKVASFGWQKDPSYFFVEFMLGDVRYFYEVELSSQEVISEKLERKAARRVTVFSRKQNEFEYCVRELKELSKVKLRKNVSVISIAHQHEVSALESIYAFFSNIVSNIDPFFGDVKFNERLDNVFIISKRYNESEDVLAYVKNKLALADTGITDIRIESYKSPTDEERFLPIFRHNTKEGDVDIPYFFESNGTRALYSQLSLFKRILDQGGVLLLDEFDNNLHPDLHAWLIDLFLDPESNPNNAQIVFSSHNAAFMDKLSKYKVVLVNKEDNESFLYRLDELPGNIVRNDRSIESVYKTGKLGGIPNL
ncbi:MAG: AAA family ATPase [Peptostreptococcaceae bacterium]|nr:AAA family ATPase [Peptostreptococcaceae bacterium]